MKSRAFVLMPFAPEFQDIYELFIQKSLEEAGFDVFRADDIINQNNILKDIISSIRNSDLIVADLTGANPNVYYELGIAHALNKPVVLLSQEIDEIPFDLRSYRIISYQTYFAKMNLAKSELTELGKEALTGKALFGNPVSDFTGVHSPKLSITTTVTSVDDETNKGELGFLDYIVSLEEGFEAIGTIVTEVGEELNRTTPKLDETTGKLNHQHLPVKQKREAVRELAKHIENYGNFVKPRNLEYRNKLKDIDESLEFLVNLETTEEDKSEVEGFVKTLEEVEESAYSGKNSFVDLVATIESLPNIERTFDRAKKFMSRELKSFISNIDQTISVISRAKTTKSRILLRNKN